ncbi:MAG: hypothetical protein H8E55_61635 [Pelagibacterales bacterium]|nr:hypothetical protein [Pelagibacterales bacterium]
MISRQKFNRTKLLYNTLTETLIVFLFILLAISSLHQKIIGEQKEIIDDNEFIPAGFVAINENEYERFLDEKENLEKKFENKYASIIGEKDQLKNENDYLLKKVQIGIGAPSCKFENGKSVLLSIDFFPDTIFVVKVMDIDNDIFLNDRWTLVEDSIYILNKYDFRKFGFLIHESKSINKDDQYCIDGEKRWNSSFCYDCIYVFSASDLKDELFVKNNFSWYNRTKDIGSELTKYMMLISQKYFYLDHRVQS